MRGKPLLAAVISVMLIYAPIVPASTPVAVGTVHWKGRVEINGSAVGPGGTLFSGEWIKTAKDATAMLSLPGGNKVVFFEQSSAQLTRSDNQVQVRLDSGLLAVVEHSGEPLVVQARGVLVQSGGKGEATFLVATEKDGLVVSARAGSAEVRGTNRTVAVSSGKTYRFELAPDAQEPAGTGAKGAATAKIILWTAVVAAAVASIVIPLALREEVSP